MLTEQGLYRDRTEAVADSIRHLIDKYLREDTVSGMVSLYLMGKLPRNTTTDKVGVIEESEKVRQAIKSVYGPITLMKFYLRCVEEFDSNRYGHSGNSPHIYWGFPVAKLMKNFINAKGKAGTSIHNVLELSGLFSLSGLSSKVSSVIENYLRAKT